MSSKTHWENVYNTKSAKAVSWFQAHANRSLGFIRATGLAKEAAIIDVGGGASTLVDDLIDAGYSELSVLDISNAALLIAKQRLGSKSTDVKWIEGDITHIVLPAHHYDIWHDRAVFHFLTEVKDRQAYVAQLSRALKPNGQLIISTFAESGPQQCSNLPVVRYTPENLQREFGHDFVLREHAFETHITPFETQQAFVYCRFERK